MNDTLEITTLGGLDIRIGGEPVTGFYSRKVEALLVYLACTGRPQSRDLLADLLWDEVTQSRAMGSLRVALHSLREKLGSYVEVTRTTVALNPGHDVWLDVAELEDGLASPTIDKVAAAMDLYQGDFLAGFYVRDCPRFEEWQLVEQERLRNLVVGALGALVNHYMDQQAYDAALEQARCLLELDPLLEEGHRQVMACLAYSGQRSAALAQYEACRQVLAEELGVEPEPETTALYERIRSGDIAAAPARADESPHNLPSQQTPFVGRVAELADLDGLLSDPNVRLVTVVGPGGMGKTRLALEAAAAKIGAYEDGVYFVSLAPLQSVEAIVPTVAEAVGFVFYGAAEPRKQLLDYLRNKQMLLVMDNFEHLLSRAQSPPPGREVGGGAVRPAQRSELNASSSAGDGTVRPAERSGDGTALVTEILRDAPRVKLLVTSRARLNLSDEQLYPLAGMDFPDWETPQDTADYSAVALFLQSARRIRPDFTLGDDELVYLTRICRLVGGMPLAVLLAAGWVDTLTPAEIADEIAQNLDFLETDLRDVPERQRSVRAAFDHSWKLLTEREREVLPGLSVFLGRFTREAAWSVAGASLRQLKGLVSRSLLQHAAGGWYEIHELIRQYAEEKLAASTSAAEAARDRHCDYYCTAVERWRAQFSGPRQHAALREMEVEIENVRAAWNRAVEYRQLERIDRAALGLGWFYVWRGRYYEGDSACHAAVGVLSTLNSPKGRRILAGVLAMQSLFSAFLGYVSRARELAEHGLALIEGPDLAREDARWEKAFLLYRMGCIAGRRGDQREARQWFDQSLSLFRVLGDEFWTATALTQLGFAGWHLGDYGAARRLLEEGLALRRALGGPTPIAESLMLLGFTALYQGRFPEAEGLMRESLALLQGAGDRVMIAFRLGNLGETLAWCGKYAESYALLEQGIAAWNDLGQRIGVAYASPRRCFAEMHLGNFDEARDQAQLSLTLAEDMDAKWEKARSRLMLGKVALVQEAYADAQRWVAESIARYRDIGNRAELGWALACQSLASRSLGEHQNAERQLCEALNMALELRAFIPLPYALTARALLLVDDGDGERATEIYALASRYAHVANSKWFKVVAGKEIAAVTASLPPDVVVAAQERGRARDLWQTADELLEEFEKREGD